MSFLMIELFQLAASMMVMATELTYVGGIAKRLNLEKEYYSRDIALMLDIMYASPSNFNYLYTVKAADKELFNFDISNFRVSISTKNYPQKMSYDFYENYRMNRLMINETGFAGFYRLYKQGDTIGGSRKDTGNMLMLSCSQVETSKGGWRSIPLVLDPAHGGDDRGFVNSKDSGFSEADTALGIAKAIGLAGRIPNNVLTRENSAATGQQRKETLDSAGGIAISIHTGSDADPNANFVKAYFNANADPETRAKSAKLGCLIINSLLSNSKIEGITGANIIPSSEFILPENKPAVMLELGNIQIPKEKNFLRQQSDIAQSISDAVVGYFE